MPCCPDAADDTKNCCSIVPFGLPDESKPPRFVFASTNILKVSVARYMFSKNKLVSTDTGTVNHEILIAPGRLRLLVVHLERLISFVS